MMNTLKMGLRFVGEFAVIASIAFTVLVGGPMAFEMATSGRPADAPLVALAHDTDVQDFMHIPVSYRTSVNRTTDDFVAGWTESIAEANPLARQLGALNARQIEFIRSEIAPRMNYICESNPSWIASQQIAAHGDAVFKLVMAAR